MSESGAQISGTGFLRPRARLLHTVGDELISSDTVAILELVKNAYDADATKVEIRFSGPIEEGQGEIEIIDNGHGMSLKTIQTTWMEPATSFKKRQPFSKYLKRRVLGEKGIGRFAAAKLAKSLEVVTRLQDSEREIHVNFNWSQFEDERYLDQIEVQWREIEPMEICRGGTILKLRVEGTRPSDNTELNHGTILRMKGLRSAWKKEQFEELRTGLARLISPFFYEKDSTRNDLFQIYLNLPGEFKYISGSIKSPEALEQPHYSLKGCIDKAGNYDLILKLRTVDVPVILRGEFLVNGHQPECGPFCIELRAWDRDTQSLNEFAQIQGSTVQNVRRDLDAAAGINIYRDGFRVLPYGEPRNDWLRLDLRRVQNPSLRLSNNQILGYIIISADENPDLRDQSNREGIVEGPALNDLRELVKIMLAEIEQRRFSVRRALEKKKREKTDGGLFTDFTLADIQNMVIEQHPGDSALLDLIGEKEKDLERRVEEVQEVLSRYRHLATLGQLIDTVLHDGRTPLATIISESYQGHHDIETHQNNTPDDPLIMKLKRHFEIITRQGTVLSSIFRKIEPFGGRRRGKPSIVRLEKVIADAFSVLDTEIRQVGAKVSLPDTSTQLKAEPSEIELIIVNMLNNSLYWLREVTLDRREIAVLVDQKSSDEVEILFADNGKGVASEYQERIFDPYFSTKPDGIGLGLTIVGELVNDYYNGKLELLESGPLPGANFRITLHGRG